MEGLFANIGLKVKAGLAAVAAALALSCGQELEVRTFELNRLQPHEAEALVIPYVYSDRERAPGTLSVVGDLLTVREMPENLGRIAEVLRRYDREAPDVQLRFQIIEGDGFTGRDEAITEVEAELRKLLRYRGYRLVDEAVMRVQEGGSAFQQLSPEFTTGGGERRGMFLVSAEVQRVDRNEQGGNVLTRVTLDGPGGTILATNVTLRDRSTMVLGTTSARTTPDGATAAIILVVTAEIQ